MGSPQSKGEGGPLLKLAPLILGPAGATLGGLARLKAGRW